MGIARWESSESLTFKTWGSSLDVTISVSGTYGMGGWLLSCPFLHSEFFNPLRALRVVLILAYCQSPVLSRSFLKEVFGGTRRNPAAWMVAWKKKLQGAKFLCRKKTLGCADSTCTTNWMIWYRKKISLCKMHCSTWTGFWIQSVQSILLLSRQIKHKE